MRDLLAHNPLSHRLRFGWNVFKNGLLWLKSFTRELSPLLFVMAFVGVSAAGVATDHGDRARHTLYLLAAYFVFEGAYHTWRAERTRANDLEDNIEELMGERYGKLYRQCNEVNGALINASHIRKRAMQDSTLASINAVAGEIDAWVETTAVVLDAHGLDSGPFRAVTGDCGSGVFKPDEAIELQNTMRVRQLKRLDAHLDELKKLHDRLLESKESNYRKLYGES